MGLWKWILGTVSLELTGADLAEAFAAFNRAEIPLYSVKQMDALTARLQIRRRDFRKLAALAEKRGESVRILRRPGLYWVFKRLALRPVLAAGLTVPILLSLLLPTRVLFVRVEGNEAVHSRRILAAAEDCGIRFWASRRQVRSEQVKNALLEAVPELQWAGVNTAGCTAVISVRERTKEEETEAGNGVSHVEAIRDGVVLSVTATAGTPLCQIGQAVRAGEVLISGYTDCGICIRAGQAEGEVFARTKREISAARPASFGIIGEKRYAGRKISLRIGKKRINLWKDSGISEVSCGRMYEEYYITLPGGFRLPVAFCVDSYFHCETDPGELTKDESEGALKAFAQTYLSDQMIAGKILSGVQSVESKAGLYRLKGEYACVEMIGVSRQEQIGDTNGENS